MIEQSQHPENTRLMWCMHVYTHTLHADKTSIKMRKENVKGRAGEMAQELRVLAALSEGRCDIPRTQSG